MSEGKASQLWDLFCAIGTCIQSSAQITTYYILAVRPDAYIATLARLVITCTSIIIMAFTKCNMTL